jgi:hypothetical protein
MGEWPSGERPYPACARSISEVFDVPTLVIVAVTLLTITRLRARYEPLVILGADLAGLAWSGGAA